MAITGTEILAYCGSCKMDLSANVVAKVGGQIVKVQCRTCKKEHGYKSPKGVKEPGSSPSKKITKKSETTEREVKTVSVETEWQRLIAESKQSAGRPYSPKLVLSQGDIVKHPTFGDGVVMRLHHPNKAEIIFKTDVKILIHSRI